MLEVREYDNGETFWTEVAAPLRARALLNNVILGAAHASRAATAGDIVRIGVFDGDELALGALRMPPHRVSVADLGNGERALVTLARHLNERELPVPGVFGATRLADVFATAWAMIQGRAVKAESGHGREQNLYQIVKVVPPSNVAGAMRAARADERDLLIGWESGFAKDADLPAAEHDPAVIRKLVDDGLADGGFFVWEAEGAPVSTARFRRIGTDGVRVSGVYTPPASRGRGFAAGLTAALSQRALDDGLFCCLHADASNALTNRLYKRVGYVKLATYADIVFSGG
jgi:predicted GNAT family acetyltransferase